jgi:type I restriction enzyme S subunit
VEKDKKLSKGKLERGDVVLTTRGTLGNFAHFDKNIPFEHVRINSGMVILRNTSACVGNVYLHTILRSQIVASQIERLSFGSAQPQLTVKGISTLKIPLPPTRAEQEAIAEALSDADALIESLEQLIAKKRHIKQGAMQELLTGKRRLPGFEKTTKRYKETVIGPIPEDWEISKLGDCLRERPAYGINAPAVPYRDNLPPYIRITDIGSDGNFSPEKLTSVDAPNAFDYLLEDGDLVFARTGASVGKSYRYLVTDGRLVFAGFLIRVRPIPSHLNPLFLAAYVTTGRYWNWVQLMSMRSGQPGINGNEYAQLPIPLPTIEEQTTIAAILFDIDAEIAALESKLAKTRQIKQGMMHNLLTGRIRLA